MIVAPIPVYGRRPLLKYTIQRLQDAGVHVICIGHDREDQDLCQSFGADWITHDNEPLGAKWNAGFLAAKKLNAEGVLFCGSSDWISKSYIEEARKHLAEYDMIGKLGCHFTDLGQHIRTVNWHGYGKGPRSYEPIGIGRMLSARILSKMNWQPFNKRLSSGLDWSMWLKTIHADGSVGILEDPELKLLSISTQKWDNKHKFQDHWTGPLKSERLGNTDEAEFFKDFPEIYLLHEEL